jgi:hypothetical protein
MKKIILALFIVTFATTSLFAQKEKDEEEKGFKMENFFTGGSVSLAFYNNTFLIGASPVFGYSLAKWVDAGVVVNYNYTSYRDYNFVFNDKLRQKVYGGGAFIKLYPVRFLFAQAQFEHNFINQKLIPNTGSTQTYKTDANSMLVGGGYTTGRYGRGGEPFYYLAVLFDVSGNKDSPYTDAYGRSIPIIRGGIQIPLFQGGGKEQ